MSSAKLSTSCRPFWNFLLISYFNIICILACPVNQFGSVVSFFSNKLSWSAESHRRKATFSAVCTPPQSIETALKYTVCTTTPSSFTNHRTRLLPRFLAARGWRKIGMPLAGDRGYHAAIECRLYRTCQTVSCLVPWTWRDGSLRLRTLCLFGWIPRRLALVGPRAGSCD